MTRMPALLGIAMLAIGGACGSEPDDDAGRARGAVPRTVEQSRGERPLSVVLITIDTARADAFGAYGQPLPTSPNIDRLAAEGTLFADVVSSSPSTVPSHATIFTGNHPYTHGARGNAYVLAESNVTLAEVLRAHGYRTGAEVAAPVVGRRTQLDQGFEHYRDLDSPGVKRKRVRAAEGSELLELNEREAADITRLGVDFLRAHRSESFFLWLHYFDPHSVYQPPADFASRLPQSPYHAEVLYADHMIGRVISELERIGAGEGTLVVLTSDHGEGLGEHGETTHSFFVYDTTVRVPLILWGPEVVSHGRRVPSLVRTVDIAPTILDLVGLPALEGIAGVSLRPLLDGGSDDLELVGYGESIEPLKLFGIQAIRFLRRGDWKYIHKVAPELYDVRDDPGERSNLAARHPETLGDLRRRLRQLVADGPARAVDAALQNEDTWAQLNALGYAVGGVPEGLADELAMLEVEGVDPTEKTEEVRAYARGVAANAAGRHADATEIFRELWSRNPESAPILRGLIQALHLLERTGEMMPLLGRAIELEPKSQWTYLLLAASQVRQGELEAAEGTLRRALEVDPCASKSRAELSTLLESAGDVAGQARVLRAGVDQCPGELDLANRYAYLLATSADASVRDGSEALRVARRLMVAAEGGRGDRAAYLDTLACAQAELGDFESAARSSREALAVLRGRGAPVELIAIVGAHLAEFEAGRAVREPARSPSASMGS